eukprot:3470691-Pleurochrysis_carterae.AAC.2
MRRVLRQAVIRGNEIFCNDKSGMQVTGGACPLVEDNVLRDGQARARVSAAERSSCGSNLAPRQ